MTLVERLASIEHSMRPSLVRVLPSSVSTLLFSYGRRSFLNRYLKERPDCVSVPEELSQTLWGITFRSPIMNAAGMFKTAEAYHVASRSGAGAVVIGTLTHHPRKGYRSFPHKHAVLSYPRSGCASNKLSFPNPSIGSSIASLHDIIENSLVEGCPLVVNTSIVKEENEVTEVDNLILDIESLYDAGIKIIEYNEGCPNLKKKVSDFSTLKERGEHIRDDLLLKDSRPIVIVKLSNDLDPVSVPYVVKMYYTLGFDGIVFGNTSSAYDDHFQDIHPSEQSAYLYYTKKFGGGFSGRALKPKSKVLTDTAVHYVQQELRPQREFHIWRTGGIERASDVKETNASMCQWFTGMWDQFAQHGHQLYAKMHTELTSDSSYEVPTKRLSYEKTDNN